MLTKSLIKIDDQNSKDNLNYLSSNALYNSLISLKKQIEDDKNIISKYLVTGNQ